MICAFEDCKNKCNEDYPIEDGETLRMIYVCEECNKSPYDRIILSACGKKKESV
tara:strand:- start:215 stop:376 length:162 start_codon:yes stop_codon:yes gene_type:complete